MVFALVGLANIITTFGGQIIAHGGLSLGIAKGFGVCLTEWSIAHAGAAAAAAAATAAGGAAAGYGIKKAISSNNDENE